ncbi:hypothetical protein VSDG_00329 [Cytospora chrysosperma]|uniref:THO complex subunit 2 n=1 Tax=Cytospora chrysosperma TaxID=252740 RepID=A0A423WPS7_CYTCH|nr:hypothetical protein VSDG_00329 [Valsa sordida]
MGPKRKRATDSGSGRPSPHRPDNSNMGQNDRNRPGGGGGRMTRRNDRRDSFQTTTTGSSTAAATGSPQISPTLPRPSSASSQAPTAPTTTKLSNMPPSSPPSPIHSGYHYEIVTDARLGTWAQTGRQELVDHGIQSRNDEDVQELSTIFQELIQSCLDFRLKPSQAGEVAKDMLGSRPDDADTNHRAFDTHTLLLDTLSVYVDVESGAFGSTLRDFMISTGIDPALMRRVLEPAVLEQLGLIRETFTKMGIRQATNILYKQANYNLLREETEGYSKLATELFTTCNTEPPTSDAVQAAFERVKGLIGTFDLDVGRVLDVTLDVFASVLIKQNRFFVKFLRISSWWPRGHAKSSTSVGGLPKWALPESAHWTTSEEDDIILTEQRRLRDIEFWSRARETHLDAYFELGGRRVEGTELHRLQAILDKITESGEDISHLDPETQWMVATKTLPPQGNSVAAQLLGFKLRFYESEAKDEHDELPANIFFMTALLIKIGFISLADLWPHVAPADEDMGQVREEKMKKLEEEEKAKTGKGGGALAMLGVLPDDEKDVARANKLNAELKARAAAEAAAAKTKSTEKYYQKVMLLTELLTLGAIPDALFILARFPWLTEAFPDLVKLINRLLLHSVHKVFAETRTASSNPGGQLEIPLKRLPDIDQAGVAKGSVRLAQSNPKRPLRWPHPDGVKDNLPYRCYWDEWADNVPVCQTIDDVFTLCGTLMNLSGVSIGKEPALLTKLAGIGAASLAQDQSPENMGRWQDLLKRLLVPALSMTEANSFAVHAVWDLLKLFPITTRYNIYAEWFSGQTSRSSAIKTAFARTKAETTSVLKRLSLQNLSAMAKKLAKTAYSSPGIVFKTAFDQIEAYPNLIQAFVECARYLTDLGYDVLTWSLMSALGGKTRSRTQEASVLLTSKWLQALSRFSGRVFKRYQNMKPSPVLQYVNNQLSKGNSTDLVILRELISTMGGVVPDVDFTDAQLRAMTGGEVLRRQTLINLGDRRFESVSGAKRLMQSLVDTKLAGRLLVNLSQYRQSAPYKLPEDEAHVKYLATIMDEVHQALSQYLDFLRSNLSPDQFDALIPSITDLIGSYGLDVHLAFMIGRASLAHRIAANKAAIVSPTKDGHIGNQPVQGATDADGDLTMNGDVSESVAIKHSPGKEDHEDKMVVDEKPAASTPPPAVLDTRKSDPITDVLQPVVDTIQDMLPSGTWQYITPEFYVTFWSLSLGDLHVPNSSYEAEHDRLNKEAEDVMKDRSDMTRQGMNKKDEKKRYLLGLAKSIRDEMTNHIERYQKTKFRLARQAKFWFCGTVTQANLISDALLEHCILPRLLVSASDTEYCFRMIKFLHENQTPNFKLLSFYEQFFNANRLRAMIFSCTMREAEHLGRLLKCILEDLARWHADKTVYEKEAFGLKRKYLGFATAFDEEGNPTSFVEHPFFRDSHYEWHKNLNVALKACLQGTKEWMHIRNAITVLKAVSHFFPAVNFMGTQLLKVLDEIKTREEASKGSSEEEHRVDLAVTAQTVFSMLKKRESKWIAVPAFRPNMSGMPQDVPKGVETTAPAATSGLRPTAAEFNPQQPITATSAPPAEVEDGEVKDGKDAKASSASDQSNMARAETSTTKPTTQEKDASRESLVKDRVLAHNSRPATPKPFVAVQSPAPPSSSTGRIAQTSLSLLTIGENRFLKHMDLNVAIHPGKFETPKSHGRPETRENASGTKSGNKETSPVMPEIRGTLVSKIAVVGRSETMTRTVERVSVVLASLAGSRSVKVAHLETVDHRYLVEKAVDLGSLLRDSGRDRASSRATSPRRDERYTSSIPSGGHIREDRNSRRSGYAAEPPQQSARDVEPPKEQDRPSNERSRDAPFQGAPRPHESDRNRAVQQDPNYGRLNPIPTLTDAPPQGPRGRGGRTSSRISSVPSGPRSDVRMPPPDTSRATSPDRQPPTGPSSSRARRGQSSQFDQATSSGSATPPVPVGGIHPDRAQPFEQPVHPDRMRHMVPPPPPPPPPREPSHARTQVVPIHTSDRASTPTGPSASRQTQNNVSNTAVSEHSAPHSAPTGPSASHDRQRGSIRRQLEKLQSNITPGGKRESDYRRARQNMPDSDAQILTGASPVSTPIHERPDPMRRNPIPDRPLAGNDVSGPPSRDPRGAPPGDELPGSRGDHDRGGRRDHRERSERSSRHGGRERSPRGEREVKDPRAGGEYHERHDRRAGMPPVPDASRDRDPNHEPIQPRRSTREAASSGGNREPFPGGSREPSGSGRDSRHRGDGRGETSRNDAGSGGRPGADWGSGSRGGSMRGGLRDGPRDGPREGPRDGPRDGGSGRLGDDRRDPRGDDRRSARKRGSDAAEMPPSDRDKRQRR